MSLERADVIDALSVRDGWAVLSVHEFGDWAEIDDPDVLLQRKLAHYFEFIESAHFQTRMHRLPVRVELVAREQVPELVRTTCERLGVEVRD